MPEKTIHGYNYKVKIWYPNAPENKTEGNILAAYDEDLAKQIQLQYPGVTYEIISKEPVLGDPQTETPGVTSYKMTWGICARCGLRPALYMPLRFCEECHREFSQIGGEPGSEDRRRRYEEFMARGKSGNPGDPGGKPSRLDVIRRIKPILPLVQLNISGDLLRGEEGDHFLDLFDRLAKTFETMPQPYQTEGTPTDDKIVHLHYFSSASDWYIVERDSSQEQLQAFGYAILNGDLQNAEWGYVSIEELKGIPQVELDFYWTPKTFKEVMIEKSPGVSSPVADQNLRDRLIMEIYNNRTNAWKQGHVGVKPVSGDDLTELRSMTTEELEQTAKLTRQFLIPVVGQTQEGIEYRWEFLPIGQGHYFHAESYERAFYKALEEATRDVVIFQQWKPREPWKYALLPPQMKGWTAEQVIELYVGQGMDRNMITKAMEGAALFHPGREELSSIVKVTVTRAEGPHELCGTWEYTGPNAVDQANDKLHEISLTAPRGGTYDKCDVIIEFSTGDKWGSRHDVQYGNIDGDILNHAIESIRRALELRPAHYADKLEGWARMLKLLREALQKQQRG